jgi:protein-disulfide isomerase
MASGKSSRRQRQGALSAPPPVRSRGAPRRRTASPRVLLGAAAVAVLVVVGIVLAVVLSGGSSRTPKNVAAVGSLTDALPGAADVQARFKGIPQAGTTLGSPSAPVTLVEYIDLQCPYCQQFETQLFPDIVNEYVRNGKLKVVMRPWAFIGPDSTRGQAAVLAAARQNRAFNYAAVLYDNQGSENTGWLSDDMVTAAAASVPGLRVRQLLSDRDSAAVKDQVENITKLVQADKVSGTPTLFVGRTGQPGTEVTLSSPTDKATLVQAIEAAQKS